MGAFYDRGLLHHLAYDMQAHHLRSTEELHVRWVAILCRTFASEHLKIIN